MTRKKNQLEEKVEKLKLLQYTTKATTPKLQEPTENSLKSSEQGTDQNKALIDDYLQQKHLLFRYVTGLLTGLKL